MSKLAYNKEFADAIAHLPYIQIPTLPTVQQTREVINSFTQAATSTIPLPPNITKTELPVPTTDGTTVLSLLRFDPPPPSTTTPSLPPGDPQPCIAYLHGGGFLALSTEIFTPLYTILAAQTNRPVFAIPYRLAPEHPFPTPLDDVLSSLRHISSHSRELNIDPARIALAGQSAGACLALAAALRLRDEGGLSPPLARLVLQQPVLDDRTHIDPSDARNALLVWTQELNDMSWGAYLGTKREQRASGGVEVSGYAAPARAASFAGLPRTHIDTGSLDLSCGEVLDVAARMVADGVEVGLHVYAGVPHGFDGIAPGTPMARDAAEKRRVALTDF